jgi:CubicO group peptidase (beta-lactamase class C family)
VERTVAAWMAQHRVEAGALAIARGDRLVLAKGYGRRAATDRGLLASLSKAITAVCTTTLIRQGKLRFDTPLGEILARAPARYGEPRDPRLRTVTIAQLLTHRSGFGRGEANDPATGRALVDVLMRRAAQHATMYDLVPAVLRHSLQHEPGATFAYTNASHLLLALVIETLTGRKHDEYCADAVLRAQGIKGATLHPTWGVLGSFGGWSLSGPEYLAFLRGFVPRGPLIDDDVRDWMISPAGKAATADGTVFYSLLYVRPVSDGLNFWHTGSWGYKTAVTGPSQGLSSSVGTLAVSAASGSSWFVAYEPRPDSAARGALDHAIHRAVGAVKTWPEHDLYATLGLR